MGLESVGLAWNRRRLLKFEGAHCSRGVLLERRIIKDLGYRSRRRTYIDNL